MKSIFTLVLAALFCHFTATSLPHLSPSTAEFAQFRSNLYTKAADGSSVLIDGTLTQYDSGYSNNIDGMDARKMFNPAENFGMLRGSTVLIIERRHLIEQNDTIFFKMWNMRAITYQLELIASNLEKPERMAVLEDNYLKTSTLLNQDGTTNISFTITSDAASKAADRFRVIFSTLVDAPAPFTFASATALQQDNSVNVEWKTVNGNTVAQYNIERSADNKNFINSTVIKPGNSGTDHYQWTDANPGEGNNYYRIRSVEADGKISYSDVMKVYLEKLRGAIKIYPNPVTGNNLNLQIINQRPGLYEVRLLNSFGQTFMTKSIQYGGGSSVEKLDPGKNIPKGIYQLQIKTPGGQSKMISVVF